MIVRLAQSLSDAHRPERCLTSLETLPSSLWSIEEDLDIWGNSALVSLQGLPDGFERIGRYLNVHDNRRLTSLEGLPATLTSIGSLALDDYAEELTLEGLPESLSLLGQFTCWASAHRSH